MDYIGTDVPITYNAIGLACWQRDIPMDMRLACKLFASYLRQSGVQPEIVDILQGRTCTPQSVLTHHYLVLKLTFKDDILQAREKLNQEIEQ